MGFRMLTQQEIKQTMEPRSARAGTGAISTLHELYKRSYHVAPGEAVVSKDVHRCNFACFLKWHIELDDYNAGRFNWKEHAD